MFKLIKVFQALILVLFCLFISHNTVYADNEFDIVSNSTYTFGISGDTHVVTKISLKNIYPTIYAKSYSLNLVNQNPKNIKAYENGYEIDVYVLNQNEQSIITVNFNEPLLGKDSVRNFEIHYESDEFTEKSGEVWEIRVPKLSDKNNFSDFNLTLRIPSEFGIEGYISPNYDSKNVSGGYTLYSFKKESFQDVGITAGFGEFQVFSFSINYHLENPLGQEASTSIAIPPDTAFQRIYYESINPPPYNTSVDEDGNWLAHYKLKARERIDILANGTVQIFSKPKDNYYPFDYNHADYLIPTPVWQSDNLEILNKAKSLGSIEEIFNFVSNHLTYDIERAVPNVKRLGALDALKYPESAICMEYSDLFIALARAKNIPAREINGYAYTENPELQPLSLVSDVLHSWPEYWDFSLNRWIPVDPTWTSTTGGLDYFNKLDLRHFTFVIHGKEFDKPYAPGTYKLGSNPQKDIYVNFGKLPTEREAKIDLNAYTSGSNIIKGHVLNIVIKNNGPSALYNEEFNISSDKDFSYNGTVPYLLPYSEYSETVDIPSSFLGLESPNFISISFYGENMEMPFQKSVLIIQSLTILFLISLTVILFVLFKTGALKNISAKIRSSCNGIFNKRQNI